MALRLVLVLALCTFSNTGSLAAELRLEEFFRGTTYADGRFIAINGVHRSFTVRLKGLWDGRTLTLVEDFRYDDGERERKTWRFAKIDAKTYEGSRDDVIGKPKVKVSGTTARFNYELYLDDGARRNKVRFFDKMVLRPDGTLLNTAWVTKLGFPVARTRVEFRRHP